MYYQKFERNSVSQICLPSTWAESCADIIDALENHSLPSILSRSLSSLFSFDECTLLIHESDLRPILVHREGKDLQDGLSNYLENSYVLNPFYRLYRSGIRSGVHRIRDIAHFRTAEIDTKRYRVSRMPSEEMGYLTDGMPGGNEELCIALPLQDKACALVAVTRKKSAKGYSSDEVRLVETVTPFLTSAFRRYWQAVGKPSNDNQMEQKLTHRTERLSPREREIVNFLIQGHSTLSISLQLGISVTTVKTHRKNLYAKLEIATLYELFRLFGEKMREPTLHLE